VMLILWYGPLILQEISKRVSELCSVENNFEVLNCVIVKIVGRLFALMQIAPKENIVTLVLKTMAPKPNRPQHLYEQSETVF